MLHVRLLEAVWPPLPKPLVLVVSLLLERKYVESYHCLQVKTVVGLFVLSYQLRKTTSRKVERESLGRIYIPLPTIVRPGYGSTIFEKKIKTWRRQRPAAATHQFTPISATPDGRTGGQAVGRPIFVKTRLAVNIRRHLSKSNWSSCRNILCHVPKSDWSSCRNILCHV